MDYQELLKKYIAHVILEEGSDFLENLLNGKGMQSDVVFSEQEQKELNHLKEAALKEFN